MLSSFLSLFFFLDSFNRSSLPPSCLPFIHLSFSPSIISSIPPSLHSFFLLFFYSFCLPSIDTTFLLTFLPCSLPSFLVLFLPFLLSAQHIVISTAPSNTFPPSFPPSHPYFPAVLISYIIFTPTSFLGPFLPFFHNTTFQRPKEEVSPRLTSTHLVTLPRQRAGQRTFRGQS